MKSAGNSGPDDRDRTARNANQPTSRSATVPIDALEPDPCVPDRFLTAEGIQAAIDEIERSSLLRPLMVRPGGDPETYLVFGGARMFEALKALGADEAPVRIFDVSDQEALWLASSEHEARVDWSPIRKARVVHRLTTGSDGTGDNEAIERCRRLFATGQKTTLTRDRILQMRRVGEAFSERETAVRGIAPGVLASISARKLMQLSQQPDPWDALSAMLNPETEGGSAEGEADVRVSNRRDGGRTIVLPGTSPETWSDADVERFVDVVGPIWTVISPDQPHQTGQEEPEVDSAESSSASEPGDPVPSEDREKLLERIADLATELASARSVIAALHASRAVMERRRADAAKEGSDQAGKGARRRWARGLRHWMRNAFRDEAKRVSADGADR